MSEHTGHTLHVLMPPAEDRRVPTASDRAPPVSPRVLAEFIGVSTAAELVRRQIADAAFDEAPLLITGEPGTGTAHVARLVHAAGPRAFRPFLKLDCRVLHGDVLERELFGSESDAGPEGWLHDSRGGSLFLDHIDEMPLPVQKRLAAAIEHRHAMSHGTADLRARILTASHVDLEERARTGAFSSELLRTLSPKVIVVPPLRRRLVDLSLLVEHFVTETAIREGRLPWRIAADTIPVLEGYAWPGNVRELRNVIARACAVEPGPRLTAEGLKPWIAAEESEGEAATGFSLREMERHLIETTFARYGGNRERTAQALQIGLRTLSGKLREYGYPPRGGPGSKRVAEIARAA